MKSIKSILLRAIVFILVFTIICGVIYTGVITIFAQICFPRQANGSIIEIDGKKYGCELLGQQYIDNAHMWGRIMNIDINTFKDENGSSLMYATPSNLSPASKEYETLVAQRVDMIKQSNPDMIEIAIPVDLVTCSGSGLDPHISKSAAQYQVKRLAIANDKSEDEINALIEKCTNGKLLGIFGEETVNVLKLNLMLDGIL